MFLDPGHNGANDASINRQVVNWPRRHQECQTTGTTTDAGYPEHSFNWDVVLRIREETRLSSACARPCRAAMTMRVGPCVDQRAAMANALRPDAIVSIHAGRRPSGWPRVSRQLFEPAAQRRPVRRRRAVGRKSWRANSRRRI